MTKRELLMKLGSIFEKTKPRDMKNYNVKLSPSARSLLYTLLEEDCLNQRTIAKKLNITAQGVSDIVKKLETLELIIKESGEVYNENFIKLTKNGRVLAKEIDKKADLYSKQFFENFTDEDISLFSELLDKINV